MDTIQDRQGNGIGRILSGNLLLRTVCSGREDKTRGKLRIKMLDHIVTQGHTKLSNSELKIAAQDRSTWHGVITTGTCQPIQRTGERAPPATPLKPNTHHRRRRDSTRQLRRVGVSSMCTGLNAALHGSS